MNLPRLIQRCIPYSPLIIVVFLVATVLIAPRSIKLMKTISTELGDLLPSDFPTIKTAHQMKDAFQKTGGGDLILLFKSSDVKNNEKLYLDLVEHFKKHPDVEGVGFEKSGYSFFDKYKLLYMDLEDMVDIRERLDQKIKQEKLGSLYIDLEEGAPGNKPFSFDDLVEKYQVEYKREIKSAYYVNEDGSAYALWIYPKNKDGSLQFFKKFYTAMDAHTQAFNWKAYSPDVKLYYAGSVRTRLDEYNSLINDLKVAGIISMGGIFILLWGFYRRLLSVLILFIPLSSGILLGFGVCSIFFDNLNLVTSFLFSILFGMGIDVGIHMLTRYLGDRAKGLSANEAIVDCLLRSGRSSSVALFTTAASFFILVVNDFKGFTEFGWIAGIGLLVTLFTYLTFFPALILLVEKIPFLGIERLLAPPRKPWFKSLKAFPAAKPIFIIGTICTVLSVLFVWKINFEWNYGNLKSQIPATEEAKALLRTINHRVNRPAAYLVKNEEEAERLKRALHAKKKADTETPTIDYFRSVYDLVPKQQKEKIQELQAIDKLLQDDALNALKDDQKVLLKDFRQAIAQTDYLKENQIPADVKDRFGSLGAGDVALASVYPVPTLELGDGRNAMEFYNDVHAVKTDDGQMHYATSDALIFADVLKTTFKDAKVAVSLSIIAIFVFIYLDFRTVKRTLLVVFVLASGVFWMLGCMLIFGIKFNFYNMITLPMTIGMGEDNSVHVLHRHEENAGLPVTEALRTSGKSAFMAAMTTLLGYAGLVFTHHPGLRSIGILSLIGIVTCLVSSLIFLPAMVQLFFKPHGVTESAAK